MNVMMTPTDHNSDHLTHIQINLINVTRAWARVIGRYLEAMYAQHPQWLEEALDFTHTITHNFLSQKWHHFMIKHC